MTAIPNSDLVERVRKLLDKAERTANAHEADAFSRKAAELIARHRIDPDRLADLDERGDLAVREIELGRGAYVRARLALLLAIANAHDVRVVFEARPTGTVALAAGFRADLDMVELLYSSLHQQAAAQMAGIRRGTGAATQRFRRSFLFGYAARLGEMLAESSRSAERHAHADGSADAAAERAVAVRSRDKRLDDFAAASFGRVRTARAPSAAQPGAYAAGRSAAAKADVGRVRLAARQGIGRGRS